MTQKRRICTCHYTVNTAEGTQSGPAFLWEILYAFIILGAVDPFLYGLRPSGPDFLAVEAPEGL